MDRGARMRPALTVSERRPRNIERRPCWCGFVGGGARLLGPAAACVILACNSVLDIDAATLSCAPGACEAAPPSGVVPAPGLGSAVESSASVSSSDAGAGKATAVAEMGAMSEVPSEVIGQASAGTPSVSPPLAGADAGASATPEQGAQPAPPGSVVTPLAPGGPPLDPDGLAVALPNDLIDAPVSGEIIFSEEAQWEVDGVFRPTFEVHTPTGSYWVVKSLGTLVSMQDAYAGQSQWIDFSSGFRPLRNVPAFASPPSAVTTLLDRDSQTPTHLRLTSDSSDGSWHWTWDFYVTHTTFTIDRAPVPVGFGYRGVPAGTLGVEDQLVLSDGTTQGARNSFAADVAGPVEWVYIADTAAQRSLILMQHTDDALPETYQVRDNDSADWVFGGGQISALPMRFSLSLIDSADHVVVSQRAAYLSSAIH
jgi:hypothetical protein